MLRYKIIEIKETQQLFTDDINNNVSIYLMLANTLRRAKRHEEAIEISKKALNIIGEDDLNLKAIVYTRLCIEYFNVGDYEESLMYANKSLEIDPDYKYMKKKKKRILNAKIQTNN